MASGAEIDENGDTSGNMWVLEQNLDQPMDQEAGRLKNMYREKVEPLRLLTFMSTRKVNTVSNQHRTDEELTTYSRSTFHENSFAVKTKRWLEANAFRRNVLLILVLVGTCVVIGNGILTPAISVLSASGGIKADHPKMRNGTAVVIVMLATTFLMILIMLLVWHCHWILVFIFTLLSLLVECTYFSAVLFKVDQGGWVPLIIAGVFLVIMYVWHYGTVKRYEFEMHSKVSVG